MRCDVLCRDDGGAAVLYRKRSLLLLVCSIWRRPLPQTSLKQHGCYIMRPEARARPCASELTDLSCLEQVHDAEFMPVAIFLSMDRTRLFERARYVRSVFL